MASFQPCTVTDCDLVCSDDLPTMLTPPPGKEICPRRQAHSVSRRAGTLPQPESGLCPGCFYRSSAGSATFTGSTTLPTGETLKAPTLHLVCPGSVPGSTVEKSYLVPGGPFVGTADLSLSGLPEKCTSATLSYSLQGGKKTGGSTTVPILVAK